MLVGEGRGGFILSSTTPGPSSSSTLDTLAVETVVITFPALKMFLAS